MAYSAHTTPLARRNPSWTRATGDLGPLAKFFGGKGSAPATTRPAPVKPAPVMEMAQ
jgi:hypothetical protein